MGTPVHNYLATVPAKIIPEIASPRTPGAPPHKPELPAQTAPAVDAPSGSNAPAVDPVPAEMRSRAEKLDTHDWVLSVFDNTLYSPVELWPKQDKIGDQLTYSRKEWHSDPVAIATSAAVITGTSASGKRPRESEGSESTLRTKKAKKGKKARATKSMKGEPATKPARRSLRIMGRRGKSS